MSEETKRGIDVILSLLAMGGAVVGFLKAMHEWRESQRWKRSEQLDKLVEKFEESALLRFACTVVDWTARTIKYDGREVVITNGDVLLALRDHREGRGVSSFDGEQPLIRDSFDALLTFLTRLEVAIDTRLVDQEPAKKYFAYWLDRLITMKTHPVQSDDAAKKAMLVEKLGGRSCEVMASVYVKAYGDFALIASLCRRFDVPLATPKAPAPVAATVPSVEPA